MTDQINALYACWGRSETRLGQTVRGLPTGWRSLVEPTYYASINLGAHYYQGLHNEDKNYQGNNWLEKHVAFIAKLGVNHVLELGTGNGRFAKAIAGKVPKVEAMDWARSPGVEAFPENARFIQRDLRIDLPLPKADIVCSADFLEHFNPDDLASLVGRCFAASRNQFHIVACYDDGHSHLTVMPPAGWFALFSDFSDRVALRFIHCRRNDPSQVVCAITAGELG